MNPNNTKSLAAGDDKKDAQALREANKALSGSVRGPLRFALIPIRLVRALRAVAAEWAGGVG